MMQLSKDGLVQNPHLDGEPFAMGDGRVGALLIHGYTATPAEMRLVGEYLAERGYSVLGIRLPGHGTTPADLIGVRWRDWARAAEEGLAQLAQRCRRVFVCGESLGGLLALHLGATHGAEVAGVVAYAPAVRATSRLIVLAPIFRNLIKWLPKRRGGGQSVVNSRWQGYRVDVAWAAAELLAVQRAVRREAPQMRVPLLMVQGRLDATVDQDAVRALYHRVGSADKELVFLEESGHVIALDREWEKAARLTAQFMARRVPGSNVARP